MKFVTNMSMLSKDRGSIVSLDEIYSKSIYIPSEKFSFVQGSFGDRSKEYFHKIFTILSEDKTENYVPKEEREDIFYHVNVPIFIFDIKNISQIGFSNHLDLEDSMIMDNYNELYINHVFEDLYNMGMTEGYDKEGTNLLYFSALYTEDYWQSYEGEWDGRVGYIGIIDDSGQLSKESIKRREKFKKQMEREHQIWLDYDPIDTGIYF